MIADASSCFYFILIRPQMKRAKEHKPMVEALEKGDEVVTAGGIVGRITKMGDAYVTLEIAANVEIVVQRAAVAHAAAQGHDEGAVSDRLRAPLDAGNPSQDARRDA